MLNNHNLKSSDSYLRPIFSGRDKLRRLVWIVTWNMLCRWTPKPFHSWRIWVLCKFGAKIGKQNFIYPSCVIWAPWFLETEDTVTIGPQVEIYNPGGVYLGHHAILSQGAFLCGATHDYNSPDFTYIKRKIVLEPYVWICAKATVLPGVKCSEGSILGAMSVTSSALAAWTVYAGNPARPIKQRHNFSLSQLINILIHEE